MAKPVTCAILIAALILPSAVALAEGKWEVTPASQEASNLGLRWLAKNQGKEGNWDSKDLGLVSVGALAFLSAGHTPETGRYRENVRKALDYVLLNAKPSGLLNITGNRRDMYNHGLSTFVLTQAYGMTNDKRVGLALKKALKVIVDAQCRDGGWDYIAKRQDRGHDLSLAVMQAKAMRGAMDIGIHIPNQSVTMAIKSVQGYYRSSGANPDNEAERHGWRHEQARFPGRFTYNGGSGTTAMAAAGAVCLQEYGKYDDFRIFRSVQGVLYDIGNRMKVQPGHVPFDAYTMYYVSQALYQIGGKQWRDGYPRIRDALVKSQNRQSGTGPRDDLTYGSWAGGRVGGKPGLLWGTSVAVFSLNIPNRYLPILQQGKLGLGTRTVKARSRDAEGETVAGRDPGAETHRRAATSNERTERR